MDSLTVKNWIYTDLKTGEVLDEWEGNVNTVLDHVNIGIEGFRELVKYGYWNDGNVRVGENYNARSVASFKGSCTCDSRDLFWFGCRCGFISKA